jgi:hypothetical protein
MLQMRFAPQTTLPAASAGVLWERLPAAIAWRDHLHDLATASRA